MPAKFPYDHWIKAVQWHGDLKVVAVVNTEAEWNDARTLLTPLENVVVEAVVWSSAQKDPPAISTDSFPLKLMVLTGDDIQRHLLPDTLHVEATGLGGRDLTYPIPFGTSLLERTKKGSWSTDPRLHPWRKQCLSQECLEAQKPCRSLHWAGVRLHTNSWCFIISPWTVPSIGKNY